ncbi:AMP-binding enzyme [Hirsutella rhossiliensis]|uniref:AMP-binding enzyme domain-containing protein n=1 Tax=Hirsutella rhossiliensis TaxID=111463 RepID=A0A9P8MYZ4_9HYPO|nr:AMP-binding enzyme domain-containing protein [Hirsutella rhossiliensis]KAH0962861.1 AMP-binding enzyme domain-containing protein [Hirsutella rhossiliensis]
MGKGIGLVTWVVEAENHDALSPLGCVGELLLEGPLVGQGYLDDPERTAAAFIRDPVWLLQGPPGQPGRHGRLYKTGDLVRYNEDGTLTFFGRKDAQVKIRGQRVELGEIEHALRSHQSVDDAVAVLQHDDRQETWIASFVTVRNDDTALEERPANGEEEQHIEEWEKQFDEDYISFDSMQPEVIGRDFMGWTSMYDGSDINKIEMTEWLDDTIETMLNGSQPGHVLEIGTGSGMILFNLARGLRSYVGLEPSGRAVNFITKVARSVPALADKVTMFKATAADLCRVRAATSPELVVLNSVVQYFPSQDYLFNVVQELVQLEGVQTLFLGDIRSLALFQEFLVARALHIAGDRASKDEIRRIMTDLERAESELLVDPAFFTALPSQLPQIEHVEILPKKMQATNELSAFRYAAVVHVKDQGQPQHQIREISQKEWIDFKEQGLNRQSLLELIRRNPASSTVAVNNIPHSKSIFERHVIRSLNNQGGEMLNDGNWLMSAHQEAQQNPSLSAVDLVELATQVGYRVEISWAQQSSQSGGLDAIFHRVQPTDGSKRVMFRFPNDHQDRSSHSLCSEPLRQQLRQKMQDQLHEMLRSRLPSYMVPRGVTILDKMPLNGNGKLDRRALAKTPQIRTAGREPVRQPTSEAQTVSETERQIREIWGRVLNIEPARIGQKDSFFHLGGNSIAVMKVVAEARRAGLELTVANIFCHPELHDVVRLTRDSCTVVQPHHAK